MEANATGEAESGSLRLQFDCSVSRDLCESPSPQWTMRPYPDDHWESLEARFGQEPRRGRMTVLGQDQSSECFGRMTGLSALLPTRFAKVNDCIGS